LQAQGLETPGRGSLKIRGDGDRVVRVTQSGTTFATIVAIAVGAATVDILWVPASPSGPVTGTVLRIRVR